MLIQICLFTRLKYFNIEVNLNILLYRVVEAKLCNLELSLDLRSALSCILLDSY